MIYKALDEISKWYSSTQKNGSGDIVTAISAVMDRLNITEDQCYDLMFDMSELDLLDYYVTTRKPCLTDKALKLLSDLEDMVEDDP